MMNSHRLLINCRWTAACCGWIHRWFANLWQCCGWKVGGRTWWLPPPSNHPPHISTH